MSFRFSHYHDADLDRPHTVTRVFAFRVFALRLKPPIRLTHVYILQLSRPTGRNDPRAAGQGGVVPNRRAFVHEVCSFSVSCRTTTESSRGRRSCSCQSCQEGFLGKKTTAGYHQQHNNNNMRVVSSSPGRFMLRKCQYLTCAGAKRKKKRTCYHWHLVQVLDSDDEEVLGTFAT